MGWGPHCWKAIEISRQATELPCGAGIRCLSWSFSSRLLASAGEDAELDTRDSRTVSWWRTETNHGNNDWIVMIKSGDEDDDDDDDDDDD